MNRKESVRSLASCQCHTNTIRLIIAACHSCHCDYWSEIRLFIRLLVGSCYSGFQALFYSSLSLQVQVGGEITMHAHTFRSIPFQLFVFSLELSPMERPKRTERNVKVQRELSKNRTYSMLTNWKKFHKIFDRVFTPRAFFCCCCCCRDAEK